MKDKAAATNFVEKVQGKSNISEFLIFYERIELDPFALIKVSEAQAYEIESQFGSDQLVRGNTALVFYPECCAKDAIDNQRIDERVDQVLVSSNLELNENFIRSSITRSAKALSKKLIDAAQY